MSFLARKHPLRRLLSLLFWLVLIALVLPYGLVLLYARVNPPSVPMLTHLVTTRDLNHRWVPLDAIAPTLPLAVLAAEDARFCAHGGVDWATLRDIIEDAQDGGALRGGSTITQQVVKNLFLWNGRSFVRKGLELPLALWTDFVLPKRRIMEIYLNIAEWGPDGVFGAAAAARRAFAKPVGRLSAEESAILAAALPNPVLRDPARPGPVHRSLAATYMARSRAAPETAACLR